MNRLMRICRKWQLRKDSAVLIVYVCKIMSDSVSVSLSKDADGFLSQECPSCERLFKVILIDVSAREDDGKEQSYCPYCGQYSKEDWWTEEQWEYMKALAVNKLLNPLLRDFRRDVEASNHPDSFIKVSIDPIRDTPVRKPHESEEDMPQHHFDCCGETIKYDASFTRLHCIICGSASDVA